MKDLHQRRKTNTLSFPRTILLFLIVLFPSISAFAQAPDAKVLVGNAYGAFNSLFIATDNDRNVKNPNNTSVDHGYGLGFQLGYRLTPQLEIRGLYNEVNLEVENNGKSPDGRMFGVDTLIFPDAKSFYFVTGINMLDFEAQDLAVNLGAGYRHYFQDSFAIQAETRAFFTPEENHTDYTLGLAFVYFFDTNKTVLAKPTDRDNDGIADHNDLCPDSAKNAQVNRSGCADSDYDGISDNKDLCPASPRNAMVNASGCGDSDHDGIANNIDKCPKTRAGAKVNNQGCAMYDNKTLTVNLLVNFDNNKAAVKSSYLNEIEAVAEFMKKYPHTSVELAGHTSSRGEQRYNQQLSEKRAQAVAKILIEKFNINVDRVSAVGYGESQLKNKNNTKVAHAENRRMEAVISTKVKTEIK